MVKVKICGVRRVEDALVAAEAGADFIGLNFVPNRRRRISLAQARQIVDALGEGPKPLKIVGLFADQSIEEIREAVDTCRVDMVQLCGSESLEFCDQVPVPTFKVIHIPAAAPDPETSTAILERIRRLSERGHAVTLDRQMEGLQGGTGMTFDWNVAVQVSNSGFNFLLAGGLTPENVGEAIRKTRAWGVDVSSGVEADGAKDPNMIRRFISEARQV